MKAVLFALGLLGVAMFSTGCATDVDDEDEEEELGATESEVKAQKNACKDFDVKGKGGCNRPLIYVKKSFASNFNGDGKANASVPKGAWTVSACTPKSCTIYPADRKAGDDFFTVDRATLLANTNGSYAGIKAKAALANRTMKTVTKAPNGKAVTIQPIDIPEAREKNGYAPADSSADEVGSNESLSGRGGKIMYGVETPQGKEGSLTGFVGMAVSRDGSAGRGIQVDTRSGNDWYTLVNGKRKATATTKWALIWTETEDGYWAEQWVLAQVTPKDGSKPYRLVTSQ